MVVMDTYAIDEIGENADNGMYNGAQIYGMGTSVKSVALLDAGKIKWPCYSGWIRRWLTAKCDRGSKGSEQQIVYDEESGGGHKDNIQ